LAGFADTGADSALPLLGLAFVHLTSEGDLLDAECPGDRNKRPQRQNSDGERQPYARPRRVSRVSTYWHLMAASQGRGRASRRVRDSSSAILRTPPRLLSSGFTRMGRDRICAASPVLTARSAYRRESARHISDRPRLYPNRRLYSADPIWCVLKWVLVNWRKVRPQMRQRIVSS